MKATSRAGFILAILIVAAPAVTGAATQRLPVHDNQVPAARTAHVLGPEGNRTLEVLVGLRLRNETELSRLLRELQNPGANRYHQYLSAAEFQERFGPAAADVAAVIAYLTSHGLQVSDISASGQLISATGTTDAIEDAFEVHIMSFEQDNVVFFAADRDPRLPPAIAARVLSIQGLENYIRLRTTHTGPGDASRGGSPLAPGDVARLYNFEPIYEAGIQGDGKRGTTIAIATAFGLDPEDAGDFWRTFGIDRRSDLLEIIPIESGVSDTIDETTLDAEWAGAMAPGSRLLVYSAPDGSVSSFTKLYERIVSDNRAAVMTVSWGCCEEAIPQTYLDQTHNTFQMAAALGITVVAASANSGAFACNANGPGVSYPASDPLVLAVGGTTLELDNDGQRLAERAWADSGGGLSCIWPAAFWQMNFGRWRQMADVALNADPTPGYYVLYDERWWQYGGTSLGAPIWAALLALTNQRRDLMGQAPLGLAAPALCHLATDPISPSGALIDIDEGHNGYYPAIRGWDPPTGWGVPNAAALTDALATDPAPVSVEGGITLVTYLPRVEPSVAGMVRVKLINHCGRTRLDVAARRLSAGSYRLMSDDAPILDFSVAHSGRGAARIDGIDPRGKILSLLDASGRAVFMGGFPQGQEAVIRLRARLHRHVPGASGQVSYRRAHGAEQLIASLTGLPGGYYQLLAGDKLVGAIQLAARADGHTSGAIRCDSRGLRGPPCPAVTCLPLRLFGPDGLALDLTETAPGTGICARIDPEESSR